MVNPVNTVFTVCVCVCVLYAVTQIKWGELTPPLRPSPSPLTTNNMTAQEEEKETWRAGCALRLLDRWRSRATVIQQRHRGGGGGGGKGGGENHNLLLTSHHRLHPHLLLFILWAPNPPTCGGGGGIIVTSSTHRKEGAGPDIAHPSNQFLFLPAVSKQTRDKKAFTPDRKHNCLATPTSCSPTGKKETAGR